MPKEIEITVNKRQVVGKKVKALRRQGITPVHLFGPTVKSAALQGDTAELEKVLEEESEVALIKIKIENEKRGRHVVAREVQRNPLTGQLLHIDFYQVKMREKVKMDVPIQLVGSAPAVKISGNTLEHELNMLTVESLPTDLPAHIDVDVSELKQGGQSIRVRDLQVKDGVSILNQPELVVVKIAVPRAQKAEEMVEVVAEEQVEEAAPAEEETTQS